MLDSNKENEDSMLISNLNKLHTTYLGIERIKRNLSLKEDDVVNWCRQKIQESKSNIFKRGKNWYIQIDGVEITVNASSYTIITAHKIKKSLK